MCSGKTTLGAALAQALSVDNPTCFIDLDQEIERQQGMPVREIFARYGEDAFRKLEWQALQQACNLSDAVIACGGGTPCRPGAMDLINAHGISVYLQASLPVLARRLMQGKAQRPLVAHIESMDEMQDFVASALNHREAYYKQATHSFDSSHLESAEEIDAAVDKFLKEIL